MGAFAALCALLAIGLVAGGCGSSDDSTSTEATKSNGKGKEKKKPAKPVKAKDCGPIEIPATVPAQVDVRSSGSTLKLSLSTIKRGSGKAELKAEKTIVFKTVEKGGLAPVVFKAPKSKFVAVIVTIDNGGDEDVSALDLAGRFRMVTKDEKIYAPVNASAGCGGAAAAVAVSPELPKSLRGELEGPGAPIEAGESARSLVVFSLPKKAKPDFLFSPAFGEAVEVG